MQTTNELPGHAAVSSRLPRHGLQRDVSHDGGQLPVLSQRFTEDAQADADHGVAFGAFRLFAAKRLLEKAGLPVPLGSRALEILILLVERAGDVVSAKDLMSRVWPGLTVEESSLRVHVAALRKVLGDGQTGRYVTNVKGRGYCFVAQVIHSVMPNTDPTAQVANSDQMHRLPLRPTRMIGRDAAGDAITALLVSQRFVTIQGPGGIGKTTIAAWVGHTQLDAFEGEVRFLDLGAIQDPGLLPGAVASALGLPVQSSDPTPSVVNFLKDRRMLLILDNCDHVIEAASTLAERIFQYAPKVAILATSRESLRVEGEHVYQLSPLELPPDGIELSAAQLLTFPATQLFVEKAVAAGYDSELTDLDASIVMTICRKLDGIALAIELAAGRVSTHGLREIAALLDDRLSLLWQGRRTAPPRHRTLSAMIDWSHNLLSQVERKVLRRLSIFVGSFNCEAAQAVVGDEDLDGLQIVAALEQLVAKSLVSADTRTRTTRYRMLDSTRAYALSKLVDATDDESIARRHAVYFQEFIARVETGRDGRSACEAYLGNVRSALEWSFRDRNDVALGVALAASAARLFLELSLYDECRRWTAMALSTLNDATRETKIEMDLQAALGLSLMFTIGNSEQAHAALSKGLELAANFPDGANQFRLMSLLHMYHRRSGNLGQMLDYALRAKVVATKICDPIGIAAASSLVGVSQHLIGNQAEARNHLEAAVMPMPVSSESRVRDFGFHQERSRIAFARTLWLAGYPDQALRVARQAVNDPDTNEPVTLCIVLIWGFCVFRWSGDWASGEKCIERVIPHAERHALTPYWAIGSGLKGEVLIKRGEVEAGMYLLRGSLETVRADHYGLYAMEFSKILAESLARLGRLDEALKTIDLAIAQIEPVGDMSTPELLRVRGEFLENAAAEQGAEEHFLRAIELSEQQSALSWRLRAEINLARLRLRQGRLEEARVSLAPTYSRFREGFDTADLRAAKRILDQIDRAVAHR